MQLYLEQVLDITLLDIDLVEDSGHTSTKFIKKIDPNFYVAIVSGHNSIEDVNKAKQNNKQLL